MRISCVAKIVAIFCLSGSVSCRQPEQPAIGQELSEVGGVSLVRMHRTNSRSVSSGGGTAGGRIEAEGVDLASCIGSASGYRDPIVFLTNLPSGQYRVTAGVDRGGR